jgi:hypothetical protein
MWEPQWPLTGIAVSKDKRFEVFMAGTTIAVFRNVVPCDLVYTHLLTLKMEAAVSPESSARICRRTLRHIAENKLYCRKVKLKLEVLRTTGIMYQAVERPAELELTLFN